MQLDEEKENNSPAGLHIRDGYIRIYIYIPSGEG